MSKKYHHCNIGETSGVALDATMTPVCFPFQNKHKTLTFEKPHLTKRGCALILLLQLILCKSHLLLLATAIWGFVGHLQSL